MAGQDKPIPQPKQFDDVVSPGNGEWYGQAQQREQEVDQAKVKLDKAQPLVRDFVKRLEKQIAYLSDIDAVTADITTDPAVHQQIVEANRLARAILSDERNYIIGLIKKYYP